MSTTMPENVATVQPETLVTLLGKALAVGIILTPLAMMLLPESNWRSEDTASHSTQGAPVAIPVEKTDHGDAVGFPKSLIRHDID